MQVEEERRKFDVGTETDHLIRKLGSQTLTHEDPLLQVCNQDGNMLRSIYIHSQGDVTKTETKTLFTLPSSTVERL